MATTLIGILKGVETQLVAKVSNLGATNVEIADDIEDYTPRVSKYGAVIFAAPLGFDGFRGGLELKEIRINIAFIHRRSTDFHSEDIKKLEMLLTELVDQARVGLQGRFLVGAGLLSEPLELLSQGTFKTKKDHIRIDQNWRCMYHHLIMDHINA